MRRIIQNSTIRKISYSYLIVLLILILTGAVIVNVMSRSQTRILRDMQGEAVNHTRRMTEAYFDDIHQTQLKLANNNDVQGFLANTTPYEGQNSYLVRELMYTLKDVNIDPEYYIVYKNSRLVFSSGSANSFDKLYGTLFTCVGMTADEFYDLLFSRYYTSTELPQRTVIVEETGRQVIISLQSLGYNYLEPEGVIIQLIPREELTAMMYGDLGSGNFYIHDGSGELISSLSDSPGYGDGSVPDYFVTRTSSVGNGWVYTLAVPHSLVFKSLEEVLRLLIFVALLSFVILVIAILVTGQAGLRDVKHIISDRESLRSQLRSQRPIFQETFYSKLLAGSFRSQEEMDTYLSFIGMEVRSWEYGVLLLQFEYGGEMTEEAIEELSLAILKCKSSLKSLAPIYFVLDSGIDKLILVLKRENFAGDSLDVEDEMSSLAARVDSPVFIRYGMGRYYSRLIDLSLSLSEARYALIHSVLDKEESGSLFSDIQAEEREDIEYPVETMSLLMNYVCMGKPEEADLLLDQLIQQHFHDVHLSPSMINLLLYELFGTIMRIRNRMAIFDEELLDDLNRSADSFDDLDEVSRIELCRRLTKRLSLYARDQQQEKQSGLGRELMEYTRDHFGDPNLTLAMAATEFRIKESRAVLLFREYARVSFSRFLHEYRLDHAAALLRKTARPICEIYRESGYCSFNTFGRAFKRRYGVSPTAYRENLVSQPPKPRPVSRSR